nr:hypothetical protein Iba_chr09dCG7140 [Ipomoea batatas]
MFRFLPPAAIMRTDEFINVVSLVVGNSRPNRLRPEAINVVNLLTAAVAVGAMKAAIVTAFSSFERGAAAEFVGGQVVMALVK